MKKFFKRTLILLLLCFVTIASFLAFGPWQIGPKQLIGLPVPFPKRSLTLCLFTSACVYKIVSVYGLSCVSSVPT